MQTIQYNTLDLGTDVLRAFASWIPAAAPEGLSAGSVGSAHHALATM
jgi:hypothetical protein